MISTVVPVGKSPNRSKSRLGPDRTFKSVWVIKDGILGTIAVGVSGEPVGVGVSVGPSPMVLTVITVGELTVPRRL